MSIYQMGFAQNYHINYEHITSQQGLSNNFVNDIIQDKKGFIWLATQDGLNRYDGHDFKKFRVNPDKPNGLPSNEIKRLAKDKIGNIWMTTNQGLAKWDTKKEKIIQIPFFRNKNTYRLYIDGQDKVWVGSENTIYCIEKTNKISSFKLNSFHKREIGVAKIWEQKINGKKELLSIGFVQEFQLYFLYRFDKTKHKWILLLQTSFNILYISPKGKCFLFPTEKGWQTKPNRQIKVYKPHIITDYKVMIVPEKKDKVNSQQNEVLYNYKKDIIWLRYFDRMLVLDQQEEEIIVQDIYIHIKDLKSLQKRFVDNTGTVWLTTLGFGIFIFPKYTHYNLKTYNTKSVRAIY